MKPLCASASPAARPPWRSSTSTPPATPNPTNPASTKPSPPAPKHSPLLADTCPDCSRRHLRTRTGQPRQPGRCDLTGLPLPPWRPPRGGTVTCTSDPAATPAITLPAGGHVLAAQQHADALISALLASRGRPAETAGLQQQLDDIHAVARAAISAASGTAALPDAAAEKTRAGHRGEHGSRPHRLNPPSRA
jgi:hypothetical protein